MLTFKILVSVFFFWSIFDRFISTFSKASFLDKRHHFSDKLYSFVIVIVYSFILIGGYVLFLSRSTAPSIIFLFLGVVMYLASRHIRILAISVLGGQWINHASAEGTKRVINLGPYKYSRHPYYWATVMDLFSYAMIFGSINMAFAVFFIFVPVVFVRMIIEEKKLYEKFGSTYQTYKKQTARFFSFGKFLHNAPCIKDLLQVFEMVKRFGVKKIFLMSSLKRTISQYSRGYAVSRIVGALIEIKFVESLIREGKINLNDFCREQKVDFETLKVLCDYLAVLKLLTKNKLTYSMTGGGKEVFGDTRGALSLLYAYMPVFEALPDILLRRKRYGKDVFRRIDYVGIGSNELSAMLPFPYACDILKQHQLNNVLDVGCGAGDFLLSAYENENLIGCGIDISKEAIDIAKTRSKKIKNPEKISFKVCDLEVLPSRSEEFKKHDVISFMFVLHEFLSNDRNAIVKILSKLRGAFPRAKIFIAEVYKMTTPELIRRKPPIAEHHLFHKLSKQGLATLNEWRSFFLQAGYCILEEKRLDLAAQVFFLLEPAESNKDFFEKQNES